MKITPNPKVTADIFTFAFCKKSNPDLVCRRTPGNHGHCEVPNSADVRDGCAKPVVRPPPSCADVATVNTGSTLLFQTVPSLCTQPVSTTGLVSFYQRILSYTWQLFLKNICPLILSNLQQSWKNLPGSAWGPALASDVITSLPLPRLIHFTFGAGTAPLPPRHSSARTPKSPDLLGAFARWC